MSDPDNGTKSPETFSNEELVQAIAQTIVDRLDLLNPPPKQDSEVITNNTYPRYRRLVLVRGAIGILAGIVLLYSSANTFKQVFPDPNLAAIDLIASIIGILCGLILLILLIFEIFLGAGVDIEIELKQGDKIFQEYQFVPSINKLPVLLVFLGLSFFSVILGFSSFYAELFRQNSSNFIGFQEGFIAIYFSIVTFSTVGYGDIHPVSILARTAVICEILIAMFFSLIALSITLSWVIVYEQQQHSISIEQRIQEIRKRRAMSDSDRKELSSSNHTNS